jgi:hypothetical protein
MKLPENGPKYGPKRIAVIKTNVNNICCVDSQNIKKKVKG